MKKILCIALVFGASIFTSFAEETKGFAFSAADQSYHSEGSIEIVESDAAAVARISKIEDEKPQARSTGCSVGCTTGCSVSCSTRCSIGCSIGCSTGCR